MKTQAGVYWDTAKRSHQHDSSSEVGAARSQRAYGHSGLTHSINCRPTWPSCAIPPSPTDEKRSLEAPKLVGFFCQGCGQCLDPCLAKLPIPDSHAFLHVRHAYRNREAAQALLLELGLPESSLRGL